LQILNLLTDANKIHGNRPNPSDGGQHAAFGGAVQFGNYQSGQVQCIVESFDLRQCILANVMLPLLVTGASHREAASRARAALDKVGLAERAEAQPLSLSGGEQQRVSIARAIVNRPQLILADEPTANLDRASANRVLDALRAFHSVGVTCIISSHDEQMLDAAARVIHLNQGQLEDAA